MVVTLASVVAIMYKTSLCSYSFCSFSNLLNQWQLGLVEPPSTKRHSTRLHL